MVAASLLIALASQPAVAWGPRAQKGIASTAIQLIRRSYPSAFKTQVVNFEEDTIRGVQDGIGELRKQIPLNTVDQAIAAVNSEIQILRTARTYYEGGYFSYRMGMLAALVSDLVLPYGLATSGPDALLLEQMETDIDKHFDSYTFAPDVHALKTIRNPFEYFAEQRSFMETNMHVISQDYASGVGYDGFLKNGGDVLFGRAVQCVGDAWNTVYDKSLVTTEAAPSPRVLTWYFVGQIEYSLNVRKSMALAENAYSFFEQVNPGLADAYEAVGDVFYEFGTDQAIERGVEEWLKARNMPDGDASAASQKLAEHYIRVGRRYLAASTQPGADETALPTSLNNFKLAIEYDKTNEEAARLINETNIAIRERKEKYDLAVNFISTADAAINQAETYREAKDYNNAIITYKQAIQLYSLVDDTFTELYKTAENSVKQCRKGIRNVINDVLNECQVAIDDGDQAVAQHQYDEAVALYKKVSVIAQVIPEDENAALTMEKQNVMQRAEELISKTKEAQDAWNQQKAQEQARELENQKSRQ